MAKKTEKGLEDLTKQVKKLRKQNEKLAEALEKAREDQAAAHREVLALLEERLPAGDAAPDGSLEEERTSEDVPDEPVEAEDRAPDAGDEEGPEITEAAERRARELGVDPSGVEGTGSGGRVLVRDVEAAADVSR